MTEAEIDAMWAAQTEYLEQQVLAAYAEYGPLSGIDPEQPFNSLRFTEQEPTAADVSTVAVEIVRRQRVESLLLGFIPTATQETVVVEQIGTIDLRSLPDPPPTWLAGLNSGARVLANRDRRYGAGDELDRRVVELRGSASRTVPGAVTIMVLCVDSVVDNAIVKD